MTLQPVETLAWVDPLVFSADFAGADMALLYSGLHERFSGDFSYLFLTPIEERSGSDWSQLPPLPISDSPLPVWIGYLGYGLREEKGRGVSSAISWPDFRLLRYDTLYRFDHRQRVIERYGPPATPSPRQRSSQPRIVDLASNFTRDSYERVVADTIEQIRDGQFYQANITRKFYGRFAETPDSFALFATLCEASPAPYSAYIRHGSTAILSSSPECFLSIDQNGTITTRPIKGSARRSDDPAEDEKIQEALYASAKDRAENLMIVDLMRNDLSRVSEAQSVGVVEQAHLYSYKTIHHLISTVRSTKRADATLYDVIRACFPAGSMTGAPKIAAMRWCTAQEKFERGVYSGAIGWFGSRVCDWSVVIRTLLIDNDLFEFQVGGGIVADSAPQNEWYETIVKSRGIMKALGLEEQDLMAL